MIVVNVYGFSKEYEEVIYNKKEIEFQDILEAAIELHFGINVVVRIGQNRSQSVVASGNSSISGVTQINNR